MDKVGLITEALEVIENNLTSEISTEDIAKELFCSKSSLEKLFKYVTGMSIHNYFVRRRMSKAAKELTLCPDNSLLDLGMKYGYGSNEAFTRAFKSVWNVSPSEYRKKPVKFELYPALYLEPELMEDETMMTKKKVDISELYDYIKERKGCYVVGVDIKSLMPINDVSVKAGDVAFITALSRLESAAGDDDIVFRIGGDEFVAITSSEDESYAKAMVDQILKMNGEEFESEGRRFPLNLHATCYKLADKNLRYSELFATMQNELDICKTKD